LRERHANWQTQQKEQTKYYKKSKRCATTMDQKQWNSEGEKTMKGTKRGPE